MPVNIPRLQQIAPSNSTPNDRIRATVRDQSSTILQRSQAVSNLGERAIEINRAYEDNKIDNLSSEANQKYAEWSTQKLQQLKNHKGDPTDAYAQYDIDEKEFLDGIISDKPDLNERVRRGLTSNLAKSQNSNRIKVLKQRGFQKEVYEHGLYTADLDINNQDLAVSAGYIEKGDKTSTVQFNEKLNNIRTIVAKNAIRTGLAEEIDDDSKGDHRYTDADGNEIRIKLSNAAKAQTYEQMNKGVVNAVDVLIASGKTSEARDMMEDYAKLIDAKSKAKFEKRLQTTESENEARVFLQNIKGKSDDEQVRLIDGIKDSETRSEAIKIKHLDDTRLKALKKRSEDANFERVNGVIEKLRESGQLYTEKSITDHPEIKMILQKAELNPTQMKALREEFKSPKISDPKAMTRMTDIILGDHPTLKIGSMTSAQIAEASVGLSQSDKNKFRTKVLARQSAGDNITKTNVSYKRAGTMLRTLLLNRGLIENSNRFKGLTHESETIYNKAKEELIDYLEFQEVEGKLSEPEIKKYVEGFVADGKNDQLFDRGGWFSEAKTEFTRLNPSKKKTPKAIDDPLQGLDNASIFKLQRDYKREHGNIPKVNDTDFLEFVRERR